MYQNIAIIGASGSIAQAFIKNLSSQYPTANIYAISQSIIENKFKNINYIQINYTSEASIAKVAKIVTEQGKLDLVIITNGILHTDNIMPEKAIKEISYEKLSTLFTTNTIIPILISKHFLPKLNKKSRSVLSILSARVGSITDNYLGGWYSYRISKSAVNMFIKTASIELSRVNKNSIIVGLHPGTVDSELSKPFQARVPKEKFFTADFSSNKLIEVINQLTAEDTGKCFAWDGKEISP